MANETKNWDDFKLSGFISFFSKQSFIKATHLFYMTIITLLIIALVSERRSNAQTVKDMNDNMKDIFMEVLKNKK